MHCTIVGLNPCSSQYIQFSPRFSSGWLRRNSTSLSRSFCPHLRLCEILPINQVSIRLFTKSLQVLIIGIPWRVVCRVERVVSKATLDYWANRYLCAVGTQRLSEQYRLRLETELSNAYSFPSSHLYANNDMFWASGGPLSSTKWRRILS